MDPQKTSDTGTIHGAGQPTRKKRRGLRIVAWSAVVIVLLLVATGAIIFFYLDSIVKAQVEKQGTASTNLSTQLSSAKLSLFGGEVTLNDLQIGSPKGFTAPQMLTLGKANMKVGSLGKLREDPIRIASFSLDRPKLVVERNESGFNFKVAGDQMPKSDTPADPNAKPVHLIIDDLTITDATVVIRPGLPLLPPELVVSVPSVTMKNVGAGDGAQNGAAIKDVAMQIITVLAGEATERGKLPDQLKQLMNVDLAQTVAGLSQEAQKRIAQAIPGDLGKALSGVIGNSDLLKDPGKAITGQLGGILGGKNPSDTQPSGDKNILDQGLKGLLGGDKDKEKKKK